MYEEEEDEFDWEVRITNRNLSQKMKMRKIGKVYITLLHYNI
jgi:hypothetical protein